MHIEAPMSLYDTFIILGLFMIFLGLGLLIYTNLLGIYLRLHLLLFHRIHSEFEQLQIQHHESDSSIANHETTTP
jgi:hypothetical protein